MHLTMMVKQPSNQALFFFTSTMLRILEERRN